MIHLTRATPIDAPLLSEIGARTFIETFSKDNSAQDMALYLTETFSPEKQLAEIKDPARLIEIAWVDGAAAGFLHLLKGPADASVTGPKPIELLRLYVDARFHGKGVGAALMDRCLELARDQGFETLWLGVWERNFRAQAFYKKYGFSKVGSHGFQLGADLQTDWILTRTL
jgi:ribosomal protein S18 acetylase RimI-like enzyme